MSARIRRSFLTERKGEMERKKRLTYFVVRYVADGGIIVVRFR